jgi:hypothetical protein
MVFSRTNAQNLLDKFDMDSANEPARVSDLIRIFPDWDEIDLRMLAGRNRLPRNLEGNGNWIWEDGEPLFHPVARQIARKMALLKIYPDPLLQADCLDELAAFSVRELINDLEMLEEVQRKRGWLSEITREKIRVLISLNSEISESGPFQYSDC